MILAIPDEVLVLVSRQDGFRETRVVGRLPRLQMKRTLSSQFTVLYKFLLPVFWISLGLYPLLRILFDAHIWVDFDVVFALCVFLAVHIAIDHWNNFPLKKVRRDGDFLYVSNYVKEVKIPMSNIDHVKKTTGGYWRIPRRRVIVTLKEPSEFGRTIKFVPSGENRRDDAIGRSMPFGR